MHCALISITDASAKRGTPLLALLMNWDSFDKMFKLTGLDPTRDHTDHAIPAPHGNIIHHVLVDELVPVANPGLSDRVCRTQWWSIVIDADSCVLGAIPRTQ